MVVRAVIYWKSSESSGITTSPFSLILLTSPTPIHFHTSLYLFLSLITLCILRLTFLFFFVCLSPHQKLLYSMPKRKANEDTYPIDFFTFPLLSFHPLSSLLFFDMCRSSIRKQPKRESKKEVESKEKKVPKKVAKNQSKKEEPKVCGEGERRGKTPKKKRDKKNKVLASIKLPTVS